MSAQVIDKDLSYLDDNCPFYKQLKDFSGMNQIYIERFIRITTS